MVWNSGKSGYKIDYPKQRKLKGTLSSEHRRRIDLAVLKGVKHPNWKGDQVGYAALHEWVYKTLGNPRRCSHCKSVSAKRFEWANKSGKYRRVKSDWLRLCTSCHRAYDSLKGKKVKVELDGVSYEAIIS